MGRVRGGGFKRRQRIGYPLPVSAITSSVVRRFQCWLAESTTWGPSSINKAVREVLATLALAGDEGLEVRPARCKRIPEPTGAKYTSTSCK